MTKKAVKGSMFADHLADNVVEDYEQLNFDLPNEDVLAVENDGGENDQWTMYFDGDVNVVGNRAEVVIFFQKEKQYLVSVRLQFKRTNNKAKYKVCIIGLESALDLKAEKLDFYGHSLLIICQVKGE